MVLAALDKTIELLVRVSQARRSMSGEGEPRWVIQFDTRSHNHFGAQMDTIAGSEFIDQVGWGSVFRHAELLEEFIRADICTYVFLDRALYSFIPQN